MTKSKRASVIIREMLLIFCAVLALTFLYRNHDWSVKRGLALLLTGYGTVLIWNLSEELEEMLLLRRLKAQGRRGLYKIQFFSDIGIAFLGILAYTRIMGHELLPRLAIAISLEAAVTHFIIRRVSGQLHPEISSRKGERCRDSEKNFR